MFSHVLLARTCLRPKADAATSATFSSARSPHSTISWTSTSSPTTSTGPCRSRRIRTFFWLTDGSKWTTSWVPALARHRPVETKRNWWPGSPRTATRRVDAKSMWPNCKSTSMSMSMEAVGRWNVCLAAITAATAMKCSNGTTSFTWPSRTRCAATTSPKNSSLSCRYPVAQNTVRNLARNAFQVVLLDDRYCLLSVAVDSLPLMVDSGKRIMKRSWITKTRAQWWSIRYIPLSCPWKNMQRSVGSGALGIGRDSRKLMSYFCLRLRVFDS